MKIKVGNDTHIDTKHIELIEKVNDKKVFIRFSSGEMIVIGCGTESGDLQSDFDTADEFIDFVLEKDFIGGYADLQAHVEKKSDEKILEIAENVRKRGGFKLPIR